MPTVATYAQLKAWDSPQRPLALIAKLAVVDNCLGTKWAERAANSPQEWDIISRIYINNDKRVPQDLETYVCNHCKTLHIGIDNAAKCCKPAFSEKEIT